MPDKGQADATLARISLQAVGVNPSTPIQEIARFRQNHEAELDHFRRAVQDLSRQLLEENFVSEAALSRRIEDCYRLNVRPAVVDLRAAARSARIQMTPKILAASMIGVSPSLTEFIAGRPIIGTALALAGQSVAVTLSAIELRARSRDISRGQPFSYILAAEDEFSKDKARWRGWHVSHTAEA